MPNKTVPAAATGLPSRRALFAGIPAAAIGIGALKPAAAAAMATPVDPVFAAIEKHKAALEFWLTKWRNDALPDADEDAAWDAASRIYNALLRTRPTTLTGARARLEYALHRAKEDDCTDDLERAIRTVLDSRVLAGGANG